MSILSISIGLYIIYKEVSISKLAGIKVMKIKPKAINYPFWLTVTGWIGLIWIRIARINSEVEFLNKAPVPQETIEGMILLMIVRQILLLIALSVIGFYLSLHFLKQPSIREKGIIHGLLFLPWEHISLAEWEEPGTLKIHYRWTPKPLSLLFWKKEQIEAERETEYYLKLRPQQEPEINNHLQNFIPDRIKYR
jgi:uncharacterized membrane protein YobD (UPF0266 family)